jgi:hypothetical protein
MEMRSPVVTKIIKCLHDYVEKCDMVEHINAGKDKRKHERCKAKLPAQLRIWLSNDNYGMVARGVQHILAMAETKNISIGGMSLHIVGSAMDASKSLTRSNVFKIIGRPIEVVIESEDIVVWGDVIRMDMKAFELGMVIYKVSDVKLWKKLCSQHVEGISIFPEGPRIIRKRRS